MASDTKLTEANIRKAPLATQRATFLWDSKVPGLGVRISTRGTRSFVLYKRLKSGARYRTTLGEVGAITLADARDLAQDKLNEIAKGLDPKAESDKRLSAERKRLAKEKAEAMTLEQAFEKFMAARSHKASTVAMYQRVMDTALADWKQKRLIDLTGLHVVRRHQQLLETGTRSTSGSWANGTMRVLRAIANYASVELEEAGVILKNPVDRLSHTRSWHRTERKRNYLTEQQLPIWWAAMHTHGVELMTDYLELVLLTGLRSMEGAQLAWEHVDLISKTLHIPDPKNRRPLTLPLTRHVYAMLKRRYKNRGEDEAYVFPARNPRKGTKYLTAPWKMLSRIEADTGIHCGLHDLRRTFSTVAAPLVSYPQLKRLLNHSTGQDVTLDYCQPDLEKTRKDLQRIESAMLRLAVPKDSKVVQLHG